MLSCRRLMAIVAVFALAGGVRASTPDLNLILPRGGQRGTEVVLTFTGNRIGDCTEVMLYQPGLKVTKLESVNPGTVKATVTIDAQCALGEHPMRLRGPGGVSTLRTFWVGALPTVDEKEPNNEFARPQAIPMNCTVQGVIQSEDVDYFAVECKKGQRLSVEIEGMRLGTAFFDPAIAILNEKRFELATGDDSPLLGQDASVSVMIPADGKYTIRVRESAYGGNASCHYRLHVGTFPVPRVAVPAGGRPGEELDITFHGDPSGPIVRKVKIPSDPESDQFQFHVSDDGGVSPCGLPLRIADLPGFIKAANSDNAGTPTPVQVPGAFHGIIAKPGEHNYFKFSGKKGQAFEARCLARKLGASLDAVLWISPVAGGMLASNDDGDGRLDALMRFTLPADGDYIIGVRDHLFKGGPNFAYRIEVSPIQARTTVGVTRYGIQPTQERQTIDVPKGNRFAVLVTAARGDWGGDLTFSAENAPAGLTAVTDKVPAGLAAFPVVFEAAADAPVAGTLGAIRGKPADPATIVRDRFQQITDLVFGQNNREYVIVRTNKVAYSVTEALPFSIRIVEPKAAIVRNGTMQLKVVAERRDGHKAAIALQPLYNPPGVAANSVTIPEGQTEANLTLTANGGAGIGKWRYVVMAQSQGPNGPAWVSSQLATIEVAPPPVTIAFDRISVEQGKQGTLKGRVSFSAAVTGVVKLQLMGLPSKVLVGAVDVTPDTKEVALPITTEISSPAGQHKNLPCVLTMTVNGEPVTYSAGLAEIRIDKPLAAKPAGVPKDKAKTP
ncbi:MAG: PPC domain-containing protein [Gemmataceae bacterium]|nr:PPC domain-containing protein [Gemmataceae bacterium]